MKIINDFIQGSDAWFEFRKGKVGGSSLGSVFKSRAATKVEMMEILEDLGIEYDKKMKVGEIKALLPMEAQEKIILNSEKPVEFYQLIADRVAQEPDEEDVRDRGLRLEEDAITMFEKKYKCNVDRPGVWVHEEDDRIYVSPDGGIKKNGKSQYTEAVEVKCLSSARHLKAYFENKVPDEYYTQALQYFIVNGELNHLNFVFYDDRLSVLNFFVITITRGDVLGDIEKFYMYERVLLDEADRLVEELSF